MSYSYVYRGVSDSGHPVAMREGKYIYDFAGRATIAIIEGNRIFRGAFASGYSEFYLDGNYVKTSGPGGPIVFNIRGNTIGDGVGGTPFLYSPDGDNLALAGAAIGVMGDTRMRFDDSPMVERSELRISGNSDRRSWENNGVDPKHFGSLPDPFSNLQSPIGLKRRYGETIYGPNGLDNERLQGIPVTENKNFRDSEVYTTHNNSFENERECGYVESNIADYYNYPLIEKVNEPEEWDSSVLLPPLESPIIEKSSFFDYILWKRIKIALFVIVLYGLFKIIF